MEEILYKAVEEHNMELIHECINSGADIEDGLYAAFEIGNLELIDFFIRAGAKNFKLAMMGAVDSGDLNLVNLCIAYGANDIQFQNIAEYAAMSGKLNILNNFLDKVTNKSHVLDAACDGNQPEIVKFLIERGYKMKKQYIDDAFINDREELFNICHLSYYGYEGIMQYYDPTY